MLLLWAPKGYEQEPERKITLSISRLDLQFMIGLHIIDLTREPEDRWSLSVPAIYLQVTNNRWFCQGPDGYFFCLKLSASVITAHSMMIKENKSLYVTMIPSPFCKVPERMAWPPSRSLGKSILLPRYDLKFIWFLKLHICHRKSVGIGMKHYFKIQLSGQKSITNRNPIHREKISR